MIIVLYNPVEPLCARFWELNRGLQCKKWDIRHPQVRTQVQKSILSKHLTQLPILFDILSNGQVQMYCGQEAFVHAMTLQTQPQVQQYTPLQRPTPHVSEDIIVPLNTVQTMQQEPPPTQQPEPGMILTQDALLEAQEKKAKERQHSSASEIARQMSAEREKTDGPKDNTERRAMQPPDPVGLQHADETESN